MHEHEINEQIRRMREVPDLRDELADDAADILLEWGRGQVHRLASTYSDHDFERLNVELRRILKQINRFVGQRPYMDEAEQWKKIERLAELFEKIGFDVTAQQMISDLPSTPDAIRDLQSILRHFPGPRGESLDAPPIEETILSSALLNKSEVTSGANETPITVIDEDDDLTLWGETD